MAGFADYEIFEIAIARETDANRFYLALAQKSENPHAKKIFEELAAEELEHKAKLELEIMKSGRVVGTQEIPHGLQDGLPDYPPLDPNADYRDILHMGIQKEDMAFRFYSELAAIVTDYDSKETLLALAEEEVKHKLRFQTVLEKKKKNA